MADTHGYDRDQEMAAVADEIASHGGGDSFAQNGRLPEGCTPPETRPMPYGAAFTVLAGPYEPGTPPPSDPDR